MMYCNNICPAHPVGEYVQVVSAFLAIFAPPCLQMHCSPEVFAALLKLHLPPTGAEHQSVFPMREESAVLAVLCLVYSARE